MKCYFSPTFLDDVDEILARIATDNPSRAISFVDDILAACDRQAVFPRVGRRRHTKLGEIYTFPFYNYIVIYRILPDGNLYALRTIHAKRDVRKFL